MRLINADALIEQIKKLRCTDCNSYDGVRCRACQYDDEMADIDDAPTVFELPNNPTNVDMIKAMFPEGVPKEIVWTLQAKKGIVWWNAPYERR